MIRNPYFKDITKDALLLDKDEFFKKAMLVGKIQIAESDLKLANAKHGFIVIVKTIAMFGVGYLIARSLRK